MFIVIIHFTFKLFQIFPQIIFKHSCVFQLLFFLGSMAFQPAVLKLAGRGGFVGELVQWTDLITTSYVLGHNITIAVNVSDLNT